MKPNNFDTGLTKDMVLANIARYNLANPPKQTPTTQAARPVDAYQASLDAQAEVANSYQAERERANAYAAQQRQARIDAINQSFAPRIRAEEKEGEARLSRVAALNFKSGIVGSGVDTTNTGEQKNLNKEALQEIENTKAVAIQQAFDAADTLARQMAEDAYTAATKGAEAKVAAQKNKYETAVGSLKLFGQSGKVTSAKNLSEVDPTMYKNLRDTTGMTDAEVDTFLKVNAPQGTYQWNQAQISGSKMMVPTIKNGVPTMETIELGFTPDKEIKATEKIGDGVYIIYNDGTHKVIGTPGEKPTSSDLKMFINQQIGTPEFKALTASQQEDYIRSLGGTPYDFVYKPSDIE